MPLVYMATNRVNGKRYIGATRKTLDQRRYSHIWAAQNGSKLVFASAIRKYGPDAFEFSVMMTFEDYLDALIAEREMIAKHRPEYNVSAGGVGPTGIKWSPERRERMVVALSASWTDERKRRMSVKARNFMTPERIQQFKDLRAPDLGCREVVCLNTGEKFKGIKYAAACYGVREMGISAQLRGAQTATGGLSFAYASDVPNDAARVLLLRALEERREKAVSRRKAGLRGRPVLCINDGITYSSGAKAARAYGISQMTVLNQCRHGGETKRGLRFMFADENHQPAKRARTAAQIAAHNQSRVAALKRGVVTNSKKVKCLDTGRTFESLSDAARLLNVRVSLIADAIKRNGKCRGLRFSWMEM